LKPRIAPATAAAVDNGIQSVGEDVQINSVFPNPILQTGAVVFTVTSGGMVRASLYDVLGREVLALYDGKTGQGVHTLTIPHMGLAAGVYYLRLIVDVPDLGQSTATFPVTIVR
jgi:hypothetical protein